MSDFLLELSPQARKIIKSIGLPIPMPQRLSRAKQPWEERPLQDAVVVVGSSPGATLAETIAGCLARAGANPLVVGDAEALAPYREAGEAYSRPAELAPAEPDKKTKVDALVLDATGIATTEGLRVLYDFVHPWVRNLKRCGRVVVLGRPLSVQGDAAAAAAQRALDGFTRSVAKEIGRKGSTAHYVGVHPGAEDRVEPVLRFLMSPRSAFVTAQPFEVTAVAAAPDQVPVTRVLEGKVALLTGAARGIGKATAKLLAAEGAHVVCLDRPADDGPTSQVAREVGGSVLSVDVSDPGAPQAICDALGDKGVDIVVHNAGITRDKTIARMKPELWDQVIDINLSAVVNITNALLEGPLHDQGRIVCLSSVAGLAGNMGQTNYAASKAGIVGLIQHLAPELADRGITVNAVTPGFIETRLTAAIPAMIREGGRRLSALGQGGMPKDVGELITFLASPGAAGLTGSVIRICGGALIGA
ncbi:MAG: 3-oxoacyl-ACP reductase [Deltaproteobacteria bacterium]|nr:3-oxoacyl-ACP reductase [Deltaproteobacteria bacterium]